MAIIPPRDPSQKQQKKISYLWRYFRDTENYHIRKCIFCGKYLPFCSKDSIYYLHEYLIKKQTEENVELQLNEVESWRLKKNVIWKHPSPQDCSKCQTKYMERHIEKEHPEAFEEFTENKFHRYIPQKPFMTSEQYVDKIIDTFKFFISSFIPMESFYNQNGTMFFKGLMTKQRFHYLIDYIYDFHIKCIQNECNISIPSSIQIDEWKSKFHRNKILGINANYITMKGECKNVCLGLVMMDKSDSVTIRNTTNEIVQSSFPRGIHYPVVHDTAAVMNAAFGIDINFTSQYEGRNSFDNRIDYLDEKDECMNVLDVIPEPIEREIQKHFLFKNMNNIVYENHIPCTPHLLDLIMKKSVELDNEINDEIRKMNKIVSMLESYEHQIEWYTFNNFDDEYCKKYIQLSNTRFHITIDLMTRYKHDEPKILEYFEFKNYEIIYPDEKDKMKQERNNKRKDTILVPEYFEESMKVMQIMKEGEIVLSSDCNECIPHVIEYIMKTLHLIITGLEKYKISVKTQDHIPIYKFENKMMKFEMKLNDMEYVDCSLEINKKKYVLLENGIPSEENICKDAKLLLFLYYFTSKKFQNIINDKRMLIGSYLNPQKKLLIPIELYYNDLLRELETIQVKNCPFNEKNEIINYLIMNIEKDISYTSWWETSKNFFPRLYSLSIKYRSMAAGEISCERLFSTLGELNSNKRNKMKVDRLSKICCLKYNLKKMSKEELDLFYTMLAEEMLDSLVSKISEI